MVGTHAPEFAGRRYDFRYTQIFDTLQLNGFVNSLLCEHYEPLDVTKGMDYQVLGVASDYY